MFITAPSRSTDARNSVKWLVSLCLAPTWRWPA